MEAVMARVQPLGNAFASETLALIGSKDGELDGALTSTVADVEGLQRGDGMTNATIGLRPRVKELQLRLNAAMDSELAIDGMFGPLTGRATREFQASHASRRSRRSTRSPPTRRPGRCLRRLVGARHPDRARCRAGRRAPRATAGRVVGTGGRSAPPA
jgi:peptidoglycan hydrolase-like protein with peptidoglycan-binding domain